MKFKLIAIALLLVSISFVYAFNADAPLDDQTLKQLHQQRIEALENAKEICISLHQTLHMTQQDIITADIRLQRAKFEAAETDQQRLEAWEEIVKANTEIVQYHQGRKMAARATEADVLNAKADLLAAHIELENQKLKVKGE